MSKTKVHSNGSTPPSKFGVGVPQGRGTRRRRIRSPEQLFSLMTDGLADLMEGRLDPAVGKVASSYCNSAVNVAESAGALDAMFNRLDDFEDAQKRAHRIAELESALQERENLAAELARLRQGDAAAEPADDE